MKTCRYIRNLTGYQVISSKIGHRHNRVLNFTQVDGILLIKFLHRKVSQECALEKIKCMERKINGFIYFISSGYRWRT